MPLWTLFHKFDASLIHVGTHLSIVLLQFLSLSISSLSLAGTWASLVHANPKPLPSRKLQRLCLRTWLWWFESCDHSLHWCLKVPESPAWKNDIYKFHVVVFVVDNTWKLILEIPRKDWMLNELERREVGTQNSTRGRGVRTSRRTRWRRILKTLRTSQIYHHSSLQNSATFQLCYETSVMLWTTSQQSFIITCTNKETTKLQSPGKQKKSQLHCDQLLPEVSVKLHFKVFDGVKLECKSYSSTNHLLMLQKNPTGG